MVFWLSSLTVLRLSIRTNPQISSCERCFQSSRITFIHPLIPASNRPQSCSVLCTYLAFGPSFSRVHLVNSTVMFHLSVQV